MSGKESNSGDSETKEEKKVVEEKETSSGDEEKPKPLKKEKKETPHNDKNESEDNEDDEEDDDDSEEEEKKVGLLDMPLEITGSRQRKKVERLELAPTTASKKLDLGEGSGERLGDCPKIEEQISKEKSESLKVLHRILYNRQGTSITIKKSIRSFRGFPFDKSFPEYKKKQANLSKLTMAGLKDVCRVLALERGGTKDEIVERILDFLLKPHSNSESSKPSKKTGTKTKVKKTKNKKGEKKSEENNGSTSDEHNAPSDSEDKEEDEKELPESEKEKEDDDEEMKSEEEESEGEAEKKKKKAKPKAKAPAKKTEPKKKAAPKKEKPAPKKAAPKKRKAESGNEDDSSDDDEPLGKKVKQPPSNDELKNLIKSILDGANLEEITMKTVCKQVYSKFPEFDLSDRKEFIKSTVRSIIS